MNPETVLVDTSAWVASFKRAGNPGLIKFLKFSITSGLVATTPIIILELVQGCRTDSERDALRSQLESLEVLPITHDVWERAYGVGFALRREGLTIPTADLIIAAVAIQNHCCLLHMDKHYEMISRYFPILGTKTFS